MFRRWFVNDVPTCPTCGHGRHDARERYDPLAVGRDSDGDRWYDDVETVDITLEEDGTVIDDGMRMTDG